MNDIELSSIEIGCETLAVDFLAQETGLAKGRIKDAMTKGAVWLERRGHRQRLRRAKSQLTPGDRISVYYRENILATQPPAPKLIEDLGSCSVWIKPAGVVSGGTRYGDHCSIDRLVERHLDRPTFLVHRLDRFVWGLMVLAHGKASASHLSAQFEHRTTLKEYRAIVHGVVEEAMTVTTPVEARSAVSHITPVSSNGQNSVVNIRIETGRKHQIRLHLAELGHPVVGDRQRGSADRQDLQLAAIRLAFDHPETAERLTFDLPESDYPGYQLAN